MKEEKTRKMNRSHNCLALDKLIGKKVQFKDIKGNAHIGLLQNATKPSYYGRYMLEEFDCNFWFYKSGIDLKTLKEI